MPQPFRFWFAAIPACISLTLVFGPVAAPVPARRNPRASSPPATGFPRQDCVTSECHQPLATLKNVHKPIRDGVCEACHEPTDEKNHKFKLTAAEPDLCLQCHEKSVQGLQFLHGPAASGTCSACHDPHGSAWDSFLLKGPTDTCLECHDAIQTRMKELPSKHKPATEDCTFCHAAHGGADKMFLKSPAPGSCLECHETFKDQVAAATVDHAAMRDGRACLACHDPHAGAREKLLRGSSKEFCLSCHDKELVSGSGKVADIAGLLKTHPNHHGPIRQDDCTTCHPEVHGGNHRRLLMGPFPETFYAKFDEAAYGLCFECHDPQLAKAERTKSVTGFRNADQNLHFVHVNKEKGRSCSVCHDVHATKGPMKVRDAVSFGTSGWSLPIGFKKSATGGSCASGCHRAYGYDRESPVTNFEVKPAAGG